MLTIIPVEMLSSLLLVRPGFELTLLWPVFVTQGNRKFGLVRLTKLWAHTLLRSRQGKDFFLLFSGFLLPGSVRQLLLTRC